MEWHDELTKEEIRSVLQSGTYTTLALSDGNDPYILHLYYGLEMEENILYFFTGKNGMKLDFLKSNPFVCGTILQKKDSENAPEESVHLSVVYRGVMEVIHNEKEKKRALECIALQIKGFPTIPAASESMIMKLEWEEIEGRIQPDPRNDG